MAVSSSPTHVLMAAVPGYGHVRPLRAIAKSLIQRGYRVSFVTGKEFRERLESVPGLAYVPLPEDADIGEEQIRQGHKERDKYQGAERLIHDLKNVFFAPLRSQHEKIQAMLKEEDCRSNRTIIVADASFVGLAPMLLGSPSAIRVPSIGIGHFPLVISSRDTAPFGTALPSQGEEKNMQMQAEMDQVFSELTLWIQKEMEPFACATPFPSGMPLDPIARMYDLYAQMCVPSLEPPRRDLPANVRFCGMPFGSNDKPKTQPPWWQSFVLDPQQSTKPLIVVTSGTLPSVKFSDLVEPTIEACRDLPVRVVVCAVNMQQPPTPLPSNVRWAEWIAYEDLFPMTTIFVTSGGYGGVSQALTAGIPLVLAGTTEDKTEVNARTARTGAAINLGVQSPTASDVKGAVEEILKDNRYQERAKELQQEYAKYDSVQLIVDGIEELNAKFYGTA